MNSKEMGGNGKAGGQRQRVDSDDVNGYLREVSGMEFTAKDFRTWSGTMLAARVLQDLQKGDSENRTKKNVVKAIEHVAERPGNTAAICRKCYIHPAVFEAYLDGTLAVWSGEGESGAAARAKLQPREAFVLKLLQKRAKSEGQGSDLLKTLGASIKKRVKRSAE